MISFYVIYQEDFNKPIVKEYKDISAMIRDIGDRKAIRVTHNTYLVWKDSLSEEKV